MISRTLTPQQLTSAETAPSQQEHAQTSAGELLLAALMLFYACLFPWLRDAGVAALAVPAAATVALAFIYGRRYIQFSLILLAAIGMVYVALSWAGIMHRGITLLYQQSAIVQQAFYTVFLVALVPACAHIWSQIEQDRPGWRALEICVLIAALASKIALALSGQRTTDGSGFGISQLINADMIAVVIIAHLVVFNENRPALVRFLVAALLLLSAGSFQSVLVVSAMIALLALPQFGKMIAAGVFLGLFVVAFAAQFYAQAIWWWDYNTGIRLLFWRDVYERLLASWGTGVGFGTETIRPVYHIGIEEHVISGLERTGYIHVTAHNAYVDAFYRMGIFGGVALLVYVFAMFARTVDPARQSSGFDCWVFATLAISLMVNVALASVGFMIGTGLLMGWLVYRHHDADSIPVAERWAQAP